MRPGVVPRQMHVNVDADLLAAMEAIRAKIKSSPDLNVQVSKRRGEVTNATIIRYAVGRCLAELSQG